MAELSIEQQRAVAVARARRRRAESSGADDPLAAVPGHENDAALARPWDEADAAQPPGAAMRQGERDPNVMRDAITAGLGNVGRFADDSVRSMARGVPLLGAMADQADPQPELDASFAQRNPMLAGALPFVGGVASMLPLAASRIGSAALGLRGSVPMRIAAGGMSGAAIGGGDAAMRGGDAEDIQRTAGVTAGLGAAIPVLGPAIGRGISSLARSVRPAGAAAKQVGKALQRDRVSPAALRAMSPYGMAADAGLNTSALAETIAARSGKAQSSLRTAVEQRAGRADVAKADLDRAAEVEFGRALQHAKPVDLAPVMRQLDQMQGSVPKGGVAWRWLNTFRARLSDANKLPRYEAGVLHQAQTAMRKAAEKFRGGQDEHGMTSVLLFDLRRTLVNQIDEAAGGAYRPVQQRYAEAMSDIEAMGLEGPASQALQTGLKRSATQDAKALDIRKLTGLGLDAGIPTATYFLGGGLSQAAAAAAALGARRLVQVALRMRDKSKAATAAKLLTMPPRQLADILERAERSGSGLVGLLAPANVGAVPMLVGP